MIHKLRSALAKTPYANLILAMVAGSLADFLTNLLRIAFEH